MSKSLVKRIHYTAIGADGARRPLRPNSSAIVYWVAERGSVRCQHRHDTVGEAKNCLLHWLDVAGGRGRRLGVAAFLTASEDKSFEYLYPTRHVMYGQVKLD